MALISKEMISAKFLLVNVLLGGKLQINAKNSNFEIFESALHMKSVSMPLSTLQNSCKINALSQLELSWKVLEVIMRHSEKSQYLWLLYFVPTWKRIFSKLTMCGLVHFTSEGHTYKNSKFVLQVDCTHITRSKLQQKQNYHMTWCTLISKKVVL